MPYQKQDQEWDNGPIYVSEKKIQEHIAKHEVYRTTGQKSTHVCGRKICLWKMKETGQGKGISGKAIEEK